MRDDPDDDPKLDDRGKPVETLLDDIQGTGHGSTITLGELLDRFQDRTLGVVLILAGLITAMPVVGAIPGLPALSVVVILLAVAHAVAGRRGHFWAPRFVRDREFRQESVDKVLAAMKPYGQWMDRQLVNRRLSFLVDTWAMRVFIILAAVALAVLMLFLAPVPFAVLPVSAGCICLGLALVGRDGLFALLGYILLGGCVALLGLLWKTVFGG